MYFSLSIIVNEGRWDESERRGGWKEGNKIGIVGILQIVVDFQFSIFITTHIFFNAMLRKKNGLWNCMWQQ
jgi:hypothetical protein